MKKLYYLVPSIIFTAVVASVFMSSSEVSAYGTGNGTQEARDAVNDWAGLNDCTSCTVTTDTVNVTGAQNTGWDHNAGDFKDLKGPSATYSGVAERVTVVDTKSDGTKVITETIRKPNCTNPLIKKVTIIPPEGPPPGTTPEPGSSGCPCGANNPQPATPSKPSDAPRPANQASSGYASVVASNRSTRVSYGGGGLDLFEDATNPEIVVSFTEDQLREMYESTTEGSIWAKPGDNIAIETKAKAAHIAGYTTSLAKVTNDLNGYDERTNESGSEVSLNHSRRAVAADTGKIFTGTASASPSFANLSWRPQTSTYIMGYSPNYTSCSYTYACGETCTQDGAGAERCVTNYCSDSCSYVSSWSPVYGTYISGWSPNYTQSGSISKTAQILIPYNYDIEIPKITACDASAVDCWPNYGTTFPGEDRKFDHHVETKTKQYPGFSEPHATNTRPSVYEIVSFVLSADSTKPGTGPTASWNTRYDNTEDANGNIKGYTAGYPASGATCTHYTANTSLANGARYGERDCIVVQREQNIYFNTNNGNPNTVSLGGKTDDSSYDVSGNPLQSLSPSIVIDDLPAGSKICVAISVWPNDSTGTGLDRDFTGSTWLHGEPYCLTIAKKPSVQFWGAGVYSEGGITTSQSVKYVPDADGFTASNSHNGLSSNDTARQAFGSWSEYDAVSNSTIQGFATGAALGYNPLGTSTIGGSYSSTRPGGFPIGYDTSIGFTKNHLCNYSSQTFSNSINAECRNNSTTLGNASITSIASSAAVTVQRLISRYSAGTPCGANTEANIYVGATTPSCRDTSSGGGVVYYSSGASAVTLGSSDSTPANPNAPITVPSGSTITVTVPGKLTIASNIVYEDKTYDNIADLPQMLIFADSIDILPNVSQVDAWLIVGQKGSSGSDDSGILNTCPLFEVGTNGINSCDDHSLEITGPVFAKKLALNRTAGAGAGTSRSIEPAERFNLRADSYLWSYAEAQRYSQAVVTYTRELAPRF